MRLFGFEDGPLESYESGGLTDEGSAPSTEPCCDASSPKQPMRRKRPDNTSG